MQRIRGGGMDHVPGVSAGKAAEAVERNQSAGADPVLPELQARSRGGNWARGWAECAATGKKSGPTCRVTQPENGRKTACFAHEFWQLATYVRLGARRDTHWHTHAHTHGGLRPHTRPPAKKVLALQLRYPASPRVQEKFPHQDFGPGVGDLHPGDGRQKRQKRPLSGVQFGHQLP